MSGTASLVWGIDVVLSGRVTRCAFTVAMMLAGCRSQERIPQTAAEKAADSTARTYVALLRAQLTSPDPYQSQIAINCESDRLIRLLGGPEAVKVLKWGRETAFTKADQPAEERVLDELGGRMFRVAAQCDSLGRAGVLGGPWIPDSAIKK